MFSSVHTDKFSVQLNLTFFDFLRLSFMCFIVSLVSLVMIKINRLFLLENTYHLFSSYQVISEYLIISSFFSCQCDLSQILTAVRMISAVLCSIFYIQLVLFLFY